MYHRWAASRCSAPTRCFDPVEFLRQVEAQRVTVLCLPTAFWHELVDAMQGRGFAWPDVQTVLVGGEQMRPDRTATWQKLVGSRTRLINTYGPTEATIVATWWDATGSDGSHIRIGRPLPNVEAWVLDEKGQMLPNGAAGELCIGGVGLAGGYLNEPGAARESISAPFDLRSSASIAPATGCAGARTASRVPGRIDSQLKIRGTLRQPGDAKP